MTSVTYRRFEAADWPAVERFLRAEDEPAEHARGVLDRHETAAWSALDGDEVVGWILTRIEPVEDGAELGGVEDIVVAVRHRRRGIARLLMGLAEEHYRERGCSGMQLTVRAGNEPALRLYASLGYATVQERLRMRKSFA